MMGWMDDRMNDGKDGWNYASWRPLLYVILWYPMGTSQVTTKYHGKTVQKTKHEHFKMWNIHIHRHFTFWNTCLQISLINGWTLEQIGLICSLPFWLIGTYDWCWKFVAIAPWYLLFLQNGQLSSKHQSSPHSQSTTPRRILKMALVNVFATLSSIFQKRVMLVACNVLLRIPLLISLPLDGLCNIHWWIARLHSTIFSNRQSSLICIEDDNKKK